uniref:Protein kinase domain-containing protein n=1 Tax=Oryza nivara TaxID=4536 RepID=A0A0E0IQS0_ORYNI
MPGAYCTTWIGLWFSSLSTSSSSSSSSATSASGSNAKRRSRKEPNELIKKPPLPGPGSDQGKASMCGLYNSSRGRGSATQFQSSVFSMEEILHTTNNFSPALKIGQGDFGAVYRGVLPDGIFVVVKCAKLRAPGAFSPCFTTASKATLPLALTVSARIFEPLFSSRRPMPSGHCATWISGKALPSPKSSGHRSTNPPRFPYDGTGLEGPEGFAAAAASDCADSPSYRSGPHLRVAAARRSLPPRATGRREEGERKREERGRKKEGGLTCGPYISFYVND